MPPQVIWEVDWRLEPAFDYQAAGNGTRPLGSGAIRTRFMERATIWRSIPGVGLECEALSGTSRTMTGAVPACPNHYYLLGDVHPNVDDYGGWPWIFWWELEDIDLPELGNGTGHKIVNTGANFGLTAGFGGGLRLTAAAPSQGLWANTVGGESLIKNQPNSGTYNTTAIVVWNRGESVTFAMGNPGSFGNLDAMWSIYDNVRLGSTSGAAGQFPVNPWGGQMQFGLPTRNTIGSPYAIVTREMITRGW